MVKGKVRLFEYKGAYTGFAMDLLDGLLQMEVSMENGLAGEWLIDARGIRYLVKHPYVLVSEVYGGFVEDHFFVRERSRYRITGYVFRDEMEREVALSVMNGRLDEEVRLGEVMRRFAEYRKGGCDGE